MQSCSHKIKQELEILRQKIVDQIQKKPEKAQKILSMWIQADLKNHKKK